MPATSSERRFRFAVLAARPGPITDWADTARRVSGWGFDTLLVPDTAYTPAPFPVAAVAATAAPDLRVGSYVLAAPMHTAATIALQSHTMQQLTGDRFEVGLGAGRPDSATEAAAFGLPFGTAAERIALVEAAIDAVRRVCAPQPPRILVAGSGPRMLRSAGRLADTVALGLAPTASGADVAAAVDVVHEGAGDRFDDIELSMNLLAVGEAGEVPEWIRNRMHVTAADLASAGAWSVLPGNPAEMADELQRRRDASGISYLAVEIDQAEALAPVAATLRGR
jgi:probable F420-dependent oxidoreductase